MKIFFILVMWLCACYGYTQTKYMRVNKADGSNVLFPINEIHNIKFIDLVGIEDYGKWKDVLITFNKLKCYPNPFGSDVTIEYETPEIGIVILTIFDTNGSMIYRNQIKDQPAGKHTFVWNGKSLNDQILPPGVYHCTVSFMNYNLYDKVILIK